MTPADVQELASVRAEIEAVDATIVAALAQRMALARAVRGVKARAGQPVLDPAREADVVARVGARARAAGLPEDDVRALYWHIMAMARRTQLSIPKSE
ncbi:MAG: chorismate mutase [Gemmatimonadaceae bacterium]|nr:chorismate mutase [Gemmatimonadaceae bacterium]